MIYELVINIFAFISIGCYLTGIIMSIVNTPIIMSIIWGTGIISTVIFICLIKRFITITTSQSIIPLQQEPIKDIPIQTIVIQHPDGTLSVDSKANP